MGAAISLNFTVTCTRNQMINSEYSEYHSMIDSDFHFEKMFFFARVSNNLPIKRSFATVIESREYKIHIVLQYLLFHSVIFLLGILYLASIS